MPGLKVNVLNTLLLVMENAKLFFTVYNAVEVISSIMAKIPFLFTVSV